MEAVQGTCDHFSIGDGASEPFDETFDPEMVGCAITSRTNGVMCNFDEYACGISVPGQDGHDVDGAAGCNNCDGQAQWEGTVNEGKCCLYYGVSKNPSGAQFCP